MKKLRVGIIGVGKLGRYHGQNLLQLPHAELVGVHDIDGDRGRQVAAEFGVMFFAECKELLWEVDAVTIAVPTIHHFEIAAEALSRGIPTFVEKPITATVEEGRRLVQLARSKNLVLQVGHIERFNPAFTNLDRKKIEPRFIEAHRLASFDPRGTDVAVVLDLMIHDIDLVLSLVDSPVQRIDASGVGVISDNEDIANARLVFENGCVANLTASRISLKKMRKLRIFQRDMYISLDLLLGCAEIYSLRTLDGSRSGSTPIAWGLIDRDGERKQICYEKHQQENGNALKAELDAFVQAVLTESEPVVPGEDGLRALEVATAILDEMKRQSL